MIDWLLNEFPAWFTTGLYHILDIEGYDHMLFLWALSVRYNFKNWKPLLLLVTAFTIGHCITLICSTFDIFRLPFNWIEIAIAFTVFISAGIPFFKVNGQGIKRLIQIQPIITTSKTYYLSALFFGFIHGMGFSNLLIELLGKQASITGPLLGFNVGIEVGQLLFVFSVLAITTAISAIKPRHYPTFISLSLLLCVLISVQMIADRISSLFV